MGALGRVDAGQRTCERTAAQVLVGADIVEKLGSWVTVVTNPKQCDPDRTNCIP
jgi:hypothetical protein